MDQRITVMVFWAITIAIVSAVGCQPSKEEQRSFNQMVDYNHEIIESKMRSIAQALGSEKHHCQLSDDYGGYGVCYINISGKVETFRCTKTGCEKD